MLTWPRLRVILMPVQTALCLCLVSCSTLRGCHGSTDFSGLPAPPPKPAVSPMDRAPAPESAAEGVDLQTALDTAWAKIGVLKQKADTADKSVDLIRWMAMVAFIAAIPAWLIGGVRSAALCIALAVTLAFAPTIIGEAWNQVKWWASPAVAIIGVAALAYYVAHWISDRWWKKRIPPEIFAAAQ